MRRSLSLLVLSFAVLLVTALGAAPALAATTGRSDVLVLHNHGHGKADLVRFTSSGASLTPTTEWSGALPAGAKLAAGSFDGAAADEALVLAPRGAHGARLLLFSPATVGYSAITLWSTSKAGFSVAAAKLVAADFSGSGSTSLSCSCPPAPTGPASGLLHQRREAQVGAPCGARPARPSAWPRRSLAAGDLTGSGKADLLVFSQLRTAASLRGFLSSGTNLAQHWHWAGRLPAATKLTCGVASGSAKFAAWLLSPTSASRACLTALKATSRGFSAHRAWSGTLRLRGAQHRRRKFGGGRSRRSRRAGSQGHDRCHTHHTDAAGHWLHPPDRLERKEWLCSRPPGLRALDAQHALFYDHAAFKRRDRQPHLCRLRREQPDLLGCGPGRRGRREGAGRRPLQRRLPGPALPGDRRLTKRRPDDGEHRPGLA